MRHALLAATLALALAGCSTGGGSEGSSPLAADAGQADAAADAQTDLSSPPAGDAPDAEPAGPPFAELEETIRRYEGEAVVASESTKDGVTTYEFDPASGPLCLRGGPYRTSVRDGTADHDDLLIFLQGGGACWSDLCMAIENAGKRIPAGMDILNPDLASNPVRDWDVVYLPYCDGSFFSGDADVDEDGDGDIERYHRGHRNLTAALEVAQTRYPEPDRIVLAGSSGGGFGTVVATLAVRTLYPDAELFVFNDAGVGVAKPDEPGFLAGLVEEFGGTKFLPPSCPNCLDTGHFTRVVEWELERDPNLRVAVFSSYRDFIIASVFLQIDPESFEAALRAETGRLSERFPDRYVPFLVEGEMHTTLLGGAEGVLGEGNEGLGALVEFGTMDTTEVDGLTIAGWFQMMLDGDPGWVPVLE